MEKILATFNLTENDFLGEGVESRVYALDSDRVLRIPKGHKPEEMQERLWLLEVVNRGRYTFRIPNVLERGEVQGRLYAIEQRLYGKSMRSQFAHWKVKERKQAMEAFLLAILPLAAANVDSLPYGELIGENKVQNTSWPEYLRAKSDIILKQTRGKLERAVPNFAAALGRFEEGLRALESFHTKQLVHGDYYPEHVMFNNKLEVTGLLDFSRLTIIGDSNIDRAEALSSFEDPLRPEGSEENGEYFRYLLQKHGGKELLPTIRTYQLYYALLFSDAEAFDPRTYSWCIRTLRGELWKIT